MAIDYTTKYAAQIAERFKKGSITNSGAGHQYDFTGARSVKIYNMVAADLVDYQRNGARFGNVTDLEYGTQEMICTQAKAFTKHLEALDGSDIAIGNQAGKFLRMEIDEKINPTMDKYRLKKWTMGAGTQKVLANAPTKNTIVADIMDLKGAMGDNLVPDANLKLYIRNDMFILLKQAQAITDLERAGEKAVIKGEVAEFDGMKVVPVPSSWLPGGIYWCIKAPGTSADPVKLAKYDTIEKSVGYSGPVVQGLVYFDAFVVGEKDVGIGVSGTSTAVLAAPVATKTGNSVSVSAVSGVAFRYTVDGSNPRSSATAETYSAAVTLTAGQVFRCVGTKEGCNGIECAAISYSA